MADLHPADHIAVHAAAAMNPTGSRRDACLTVADGLTTRAERLVATGHPADALQAKRLRDRAAVLRQSTNPPTMNLPEETP